MDQLTTLHPGDKVLLAVPANVDLGSDIKEIMEFLAREFPEVAFRFVHTKDEVKVVFVYRDDGHF